MNLNYCIDQLTVEIPKGWSPFLSTQLRSQILSNSISISIINTELLTSIANADVLQSGIRSQILMPSQKIDLNRR